MHVTVVGAGIMGLTAAVRLLQHGHDVEVVAQQRTPRTTSDVAAALWFPFLAEPRERVLPWALATREEQRRLLARAGAGVRLRTCRELHRVDAGPPWWASAVGARPERSGLPPGFAVAWACEAPVVEMPAHLRFLEAAVLRLGGRFRHRRLRDLQEAARGADAVVNCSGLGARELARDPSLRPVRGQVVRVAAQRGDPTFLVAGEATYAIARDDVVVLGGTAQVGDEETAARADDTAGIRRRLAVIAPALARRPAVSEAAGLRPWRPAVRLERQGRVVHDYGHGGSGVTVSFGCADEVAALVEEIGRGR
ncbi:MAG TPA: FAD-dependent oxidoreductase [Candidatus Thermoplasmatota archaeon]|nr:FAD-dependent oxidoreductase [Candidatus Thermoplasmatota archaeon]